MGYLSYKKSIGGRHILLKINLFARLSTYLCKKKGITHPKGIFLKHIIEKYLKSRRNLVFADIGAGNGQYLLSIDGYFSKKYAVDNDDYYKKNFEDRKIEFYKKDVNFDKLPFLDKSIDLILCFHLIEHLKNPSLLLKEIKRVLKDGGIIVIFSPDIRKYKWRFYDDVTHVKPYTPYSLEMITTSCGLRTLYCGNGRNLYIWGLMVLLPDIISEKLTSLYYGIGKDIFYIGTPQ